MLQRHSIVDTHMHIWAEPRPNRPYPWTPDPHPVEDLLPVLDEAGVQAAIQVTPLIMGWDNRYGLAAAEAHPERIAVFGRFDPEAADPERRLTDWFTHPRAIGVRFTFFGSSLDQLRRDDLEAFWVAAERLRVPVAVFAPDDLVALVRVLERHPDLRLIVDHLGLGVYEGCDDPLAGFPLLREFVPFPQVLVKISGLPEASTEGYPFRDLHAPLEQALAWFGHERLLWASNYPVVLQACTYRESLEYLFACEFLEEGALAAILGGNARRALGI